MYEQTIETAPHEEFEVLEKPGASKDDALLAELGYKPELKRNFSVLQVFGIAFSIMSLLPSIASTLFFSLPAGPVGMTWGWLVPCFFILTVGLSMGEMGSSLPTSGGLYWWTFHFAPEKAKKPLSFLAGYASTLGLTGGVVSINYGFSAMVLSIPSMVSETFTPNKYMTYGVFAACMLSHAIVGTLATKIISRLQTFCIVTNLVIILITIIAVPLGTEKLNSGSYVFGHTENLTSWPYGWSFVLAWLSPIWTINSFDSCVHMAEEASNAAVAVPFGIVASISMCAVLGFLITSVLAACISPDIASVYGTPLGQPMAQIYLDSLGKKWAVGMMCTMFVVQWFMGLSLAIAASRQTWAFSRDGALPFSRFLRPVNYKLSVPVRAVWFVCGLGTVIGCLSLIDVAATNALFSLAVASNGLGWLLPIACRAFFNNDKFRPGPFYLGKFFSKWVGRFASVYLVFVITILTMFPTSGPNPNKDDMNYTCVINGAVWIGCLAYYYIDARKWFTGPKTTLEFVDDIQQVEGEEQKVKTVVNLDGKTY